MDNMTLKPIAKIHTDFPVKFGIPRQSGIVDELEAEIVFEPEFRNPDIVRGMTTFTHLWLIWGFSEVNREKWTATVRPPRLGGNKRMGVFATRSPFRPNPLGLSCVKLKEILYNERGPVIIVSGADLLDGTPIYDIKPYIKYADCHIEADSGSFTLPDCTCEVVIPEDELKKVATEKRAALIAVLKQNPVPAYQHDKGKNYSFEFSDYHINFTQIDGKIIVSSIVNIQSCEEKNVADVQ